MTTVHVLSVFVTADGAYGNPLGVVLDGVDVASADRQRIAAELAYSETVFVDTSLDDAAATICIDIYTPTQRLPFAGHPTVGTAWLLAQVGQPVAALRTQAGDVATWGDGEMRWVRARPEWAPDFTLHRHPSPDDVLALDGAPAGVDALYAWAWADEGIGAVRARMFGPGVGVAEDEATGAAAIRLTAHVGRPLTILQGRGSVLHTRLGPHGTVELGGRVMLTEVRTVDQF
jgi:predicted PhzF superfamily epimerase YddE/YHI9